MLAVLSGEQLSARSSREARRSSRAVYAPALDSFAINPALGKIDLRPAASLPFPLRILRPPPTADFCSLVLRLFERNLRRWNNLRCFFLPFENRLPRRDRSWLFALTSWLKMLSSFSKSLNDSDGHAWSFQQRPSHINVLPSMKIKEGGDSYGITLANLCQQVAAFLMFALATRLSKSRSTLQRGSQTSSFCAFASNKGKVSYKLSLYCSFHRLHKTTSCIFVSHLLPAPYAAPNLDILVHRI